MRPIWVFAAVGLTFAAAAWAADAVSRYPIAAVWKAQDMRFNYMGRLSRYTCEGLRDKVRAMLLDLGARRDLSVTALGCEDTQSPGLHVVFAVPAPADGASPFPRPADGAVDAQFERFTITSDAFRNMGIADCELVEEFAHQLLPRFVTRALRQDITCVPFEQGESRFLVQGEVLRTRASR